MAGFTPAPAAVKMRIIEGIPYYRKDAAITITANRVYITPIIIPHKVTVDRIGIIHDASAGGNFRAGIYKDNTDTPVGGALLVESASIAGNGTNKTQDLLIPETVLPAGTYWLANAPDTNCQVAATDLQFAAGGSLQGHYYDLGAWVALTDPCPATTAGTLPMGTSHVRCKI